MQKIEVAQQSPSQSDSDMNLEATLRQFGIGLMSFLFSPGAVDFYSALSAELGRHKTLARRFYDLGPGRTRANLAALLTAAAKNGELKIADAEEAAEHLVGLWQGISNYQLSLGIGVDSIHRSIPKRVDGRYQTFGSLKQIWDRALAQHFAWERVLECAGRTGYSAGIRNFERP